MPTPNNLNFFRIYSYKKLLFIQNEYLIHIELLLFQSQIEFITASCSSVDAAADWKTKVQSHCFKMPCMIADLL